MKGKVTKMTKTITWNDNEIKAIKKMHRYANVSNQINTFAVRLANANNIDNWRAKIISVMLPEMQQQNGLLSLTQIIQMYKLCF